MKKHFSFFTSARRGMEINAENKEGYRVDKSGVIIPQNAAIKTFKERKGIAGTKRK